MIVGYVSQNTAERGKQLCFIKGNLTLFSLRCVRDEVFSEREKRKNETIIHRKERYEQAMTTQAAPVCSICSTCVLPVSPFLFPFFLPSSFPSFFFSSFFPSFLLFLLFLLFPSSLPPFFFRFLLPLSSSLYRDAWQRCRCC